MKEEQRLAGGKRGAGIHLPGSAARRGYHAIAEALRQLRRAVRAAAVGDDDLVPACAQRRQREQRRTNHLRLVQRGDDDGESLSDQSYSRKCSAYLPAAIAA